MERLLRYASHLLFGISFLLYAHTLTHGFVFDDEIVLVNNQHVTGGIDRLDEIWTTNYLNGYQGFNDALYRPMSQTVFNLVYSFFGDDPWPYHAFNILLYAFLVVLAYRLFIRVHPQKKAIVFWGCLLFAVHPIHTEVVANIKSLDELLALFFGLLASFFALRFHEKPQALAGVLLAYAAALFSKESAIVFAVLIPAFFFFGHAVMPRRQFAILTGSLTLLSLLWYAWHAHVIASMPRAVDTGLFDAVSNSIVGIEDPFIRLTTGLWLVTKYALKLIFPWPLLGDYSFNSIPPVSLLSFRFAVTLLFFGTSAFLFFKGFLKKRALSLSLLLFFTAIIPLSNVLVYIGTTFAERLVFTASVALVPLVVYLLPKLKEKWQPALLFLIIPFAGMSLWRASEWKNNFSLFKADAQRNPDSYRTHYNYATALSAQVQEKATTENEKASVELAIAEYKKALAITPGFSDASLNLGNAYKKLNQYKKALEVYEKLILDKPDYARAYYNKGITLYQLQQYTPARESLLMYTRLGHANTAAAYYWAGVCSGYLEDFDGAKNYLTQALTINPKMWEAWNFLGMAYGNTQEWEKAIEAFTEAFVLNPSGEVKRNLEMAKGASKAE